MTKNEQKYINSLKEENERVKNLLLRFVDALGKLKNLDDVVNMSLIPLMTEENQKIRAEIKAEAYKEFAERFNKEAEKVEIDQEGDFVEFDNKIYNTVADWCKATSNNLLKEVGEDSE